MVGDEGRPRPGPGAASRGSAVPGPASGGHLVPLAEPAAAAQLSTAGPGPQGHLPHSPPPRSPHVSVFLPPPTCPAGAGDTVKRTAPEAGGLGLGPHADTCSLS